MQKILVIDDDEFIRDALNSFLKSNGYDVVLAESGQSGLNLLKEDKFDIVLTDLIMPGIEGIGILREISKLKTKTPVVVMTAYGTIQTAVEAMKMGASDYITKPFIPDELKIILERSLDNSRIEKENEMLKTQIRNKYNFEGLLGDSAEIQKVYELIGRIADTDSTVLITGESGTGKELIAKTIHYNSSRSQWPFVPLNCAAIPKDLLESELFGHEKGAFTGALNTRIGRFERANNGTIFLDEIGELDPSLQVKLLRVIQEREFERVGGVKTIKADVRILAATNRDIEVAIKEGRFREDLFYRLNVLNVHLPPLRERSDDIPLLIDHFVHEFSKKKRSAPLKFSKEMMEIIMRYSWPGNIRELKNLIERLTILVSGDTASVSDLPEKFQHLSATHTKGAQVKEEPETEFISDYDRQTIDVPDCGIDLRGIIDSMERELILKALKKTGGVKNRAAGLLGLNRTTLIEKMKKMGLELQGREA